MTAVVAGIDSSTQSCTVVLRTLDDGATVAVHSSRHPQTTPPVSEQHPDRPVDRPGRPPMSLRSAWASSHAPSVDRR